MNANMNRLLLAALGGIAGMSLAILMAPGSKRERERLGRVAGEVGETVREGLQTRLRSTPLMESGQELARQIAERAQVAAHRAQEAVSRVRTAGGVGGSSHAASEALEEASEAATKALEAVEELVKRTEHVIDAAKRKID